MILFTCCFVWYSFQLINRCDQSPAISVCSHSSSTNSYITEKNLMQQCLVSTHRANFGKTTNFLISGYLSSLNRSAKGNPLHFCSVPPLLLKTSLYNSIFSYRRIKISFSFRCVLKTKVQVRHHSCLRCKVPAS